MGIAEQCESSLKKIIMAFLAFTLIPVSPVKADWNRPMPHEWYLDLARCETSNNTRHGYPLNPHSRFVTAFGMTRHAFSLFADASPKYAYKLSFAKQAVVVDRLAWYGHTEKGKKQWPVGPWGFTSIRSNCKNLATRLCESKSRAVQKWLNRCSKYLPKRGNNNGIIRDS